MSLLVAGLLPVSRANTVKRSMSLPSSVRIFFSYIHILIHTPSDGLLSFAFLMLLLVVPTQTSPTRQRAQVYLWSAIIVIVYSLLLSLFRVKNRGYPFKLFF